MAHQSATIIVVQFLLLCCLSFTIVECKCRLEGLGNDYKGLSCSTRVLGKELKMMFKVSLSEEDPLISATIEIDGLDIKISYDHSALRKMIKSASDWCDSKRLCRFILSGEFRQLLERAQKVIHFWRQSAKICHMTKTVMSILS